MPPATCCSQANKNKQLNTTLGVDVEVAEIDPRWRSYGAGISLGGATLRAFKTLGILDRFLEQGAAADGVDLMLPHGQYLSTVPTPRLAGADVPGGGAIMRPVLAKILADATIASGARVRLGCTTPTWPSRRPSEQHLTT